jgi:hypothetical protein
MALNCVDRQKRLSYSTNAWKRDVITLIPRGLGLAYIRWRRTNGMGLPSCFARTCLERAIPSRRAIYTPMFPSIELSSDGMGLRKDRISLPVRYRIPKKAPFTLDDSSIPRDLPNLLMKERTEVKAHPTTYSHPPTTKRRKKSASALAIFHR